MNAHSKDEIRVNIFQDLQLIHDRKEEMSKRLREDYEDNFAYARELAVQLSQPSTGPLVPKTPKMLRKRAVQRIETIPEDEVFKQDIISSTSFLQSVNEEEQKESEEGGRRPRRETSKRAAENIKKQSLLNDSVKKMKRDNQPKRKKAVVSSSDEDTERVSKYSKVEENLLTVKESTRMTRKKSKQIVQSKSSMELEKSKESEKINENNFESPALRRSSRVSLNTASSKSSQNSEVNKVDAIVTSNADDVEEQSMYEDAIGKPIPIMNSTLKQSLASEKMLNATVVIERLPQLKLNETVVIQKSSGSARNSKKSRKRESAKKALKDDMQLHKTSAQYNNYDELITDDESSPEVKKSRKQLTKVNKKQIKNTSSEDEIPTTPVKTRQRDIIMRPTVGQESKATHKSNALFSPYAKESVKKRVEAFEQAVMHSPKSVDIDAPTRLTRTKTRAMANAEMETEGKNIEKNVTQMLARKSLVRAKKISLAKQKKDHDEFKEVKESVNKEQLPERINYKLLLAQTEKPNVKQNLQQLKTTPLSKLKLMQPILSVNRLHTPSNTQNLSNYPKGLTAPRANIVTGMDSFVQPPKSVTKINSMEKLEEKRRHEEDARKKRGEALRLLTEEKRRKRQEKELRNKLAREAKEKQELEKRQKTEREREEKAKLALVMQEKQREELEKKKLALLQRAQEKEERRKLEMQQKLQKLQEQEETERLLAEQRRREQEAEKRKEAEARAAQQAAAEALKQKNQLLAAQVKQKPTNSKQQVVNYVLDSEPDDDDSDDESRPKHEVPHWALPHVRKAQLATQLYIPEEIVYKFFDTRKCTPDLTAMFQGIDKNRIKRTSSAIWKSPPRMSMMETEFIKP